jgi:hypothetical protein
LYPFATTVQRFNVLWLAWAPNWLDSFTHYSQDRNSYHIERKKQAKNWHTKVSSYKIPHFFYLILFRNDKTVLICQAKL